MVKEGENNISLGPKDAAVVFTEDGNMSAYIPVGNPDDDVDAAAPMALVAKVGLFLSDNPKAALARAIIDSLLAEQNTRS